MYLALSRAPRLLVQIVLATLAAKLLWDTGKTLPRERFALVPSTAGSLHGPARSGGGLFDRGVGRRLHRAVAALLRAEPRARRRRLGPDGSIRAGARGACTRLVAGCLALWRRRWHEVHVWVLGAACYAVYYSLHAMEVLKHIRPDDRAHLSSWVALGGLPFLAGTLKTNGLLLLAPRFVVAIVAVALVAAWWNWRLPLHARVTLVMYGGLFLVVGLAGQRLLGILPIAPTVSLWMAYSLGGLRALWDPASLTSDARPVRPSLAPHAEHA